MPPSDQPPRHLHDANLERIVAALCACGPASRSELARRTGLSRAAISNLLRELVSQGRVSRAPRTGDGVRGRQRRSAYFGLTLNEGVVVGAAIGDRSTHVAIADLSATVLAETAREIDPCAAPSATFDAIAEATSAMLADVGIPRNLLVGAGVALPGPIDSETDSLSRTTVVPSWHGVNAVPEPCRRLGVGVVADKHANLAALGESRLGAARDVEDLIYLDISAGITAGLLIGGRLFHGATGIGGEIGHVSVQHEGRVCRCGNRGCLETIASGPAIQELLAPLHGDAPKPDQIVKMAFRRDQGAARILYDAGRAIGAVLGDLCNVFTPEAVVIG